MSQDTNQDRRDKCERIVANIIDHCNTAGDEGVDGFAIAFGPDVWGRNSLTIYKHGGAHTHVGFTDITTDELIDKLHDLLVEGRGLSWA